MLFAHQQITLYYASLLVLPSRLTNCLVVCAFVVVVGSSSKLYSSSAEIFLLTDASISISNLDKLLLLMLLAIALAGASDKHRLYW